MTITRDDVAEYLDGQFSALAASVGQDSDPLTGFEPDINLALRKLGITRAGLATATVEDSQEEAVQTLAEYYALRRIWRQLGDRVKHSMGQTSYDFASQQESVEKMVAEAKKSCAALGYNVSRIANYNSFGIPTTSAW